MYYNFDIVSCIMYMSSLMILFAKRWTLTERRSAIYGLTFLGSIYLIGAITLTYSWHLATGETFIKPFYELDTLNFAVISLTPGLLLLYFLQICIKNPKREWVVFIWPVLQTAYVLFLNKKFGWIFYYEDGVYHRGPYLWASYLLWVTYVAISIYLIYKHRRRLEKKMIMAFILFFVSEILLQIYQAMNIEFYVTGISISLGLLFLILAPVALSSVRDVTTGLYNRTGFDMVVRDALISRSSSENLQVLLVDIHHFKTINERYGFDAGNKVLTYVSRFLTKWFPETADIARVGSDKFFILTPKARGTLPLPNQDVRKSLGIETPYEISFAAGIYDIRPEDDDPVIVIDKAYFALEMAKSGDYRNRYRHFDDKTQQKLAFRSYMIRQMQNALDNQDFQVFFQPIYEVETQRLVGAEALARWKDSKYSWIPPHEFIPIFESNGFISTLDTYILDKVCDCCSRWKEAGLNTIPITVNLSRVDITTPGFLDIYSNILKKYDLSPSDIYVEVTESAFVPGEEFKGILERIRSMGSKVLMDDFGSGYSNLSNLAGMPLDILKADMMFMEDLKNTDRGKNLVSAITDMADRLELPIIAEGVETQAQMDFLKSIHVNYAQGYLLSKPMPEEEIVSLLQNQDPATDQDPKNAI